jgi:histidyl-tRNA synthetase
MAQKPSIPKGTRDFIPQEVIRRNYIFNTISTVFKQYGYLPIETPAMENLSTLMGKYGEEGDKLLFKILNSGDFLQHSDPSELANKNSNRILSSIAEKGLRYDLTVPFARFVVQHQNELTFPFKRYQIQPVWRADRPQAGRYREFFQCDVDVIGSNSLLNEVELLQIIDEVFNRLNISVLIKLNNRKILTGIAEIIGQPDKIIPITVAIDKIDKIGFEAVIQELRNQDLSDDSILRLQPILQMEGDNQHKLKVIREVLADSSIGLIGVDELQRVFQLIESAGIQTNIELDLTLARGLNYYTGAILEVKSMEVAIGSICGGGRYDDLTGIFGLPGMSGVGISFGADRIYDVLNQLNRFPQDQLSSTQVLFLNFGEKDEAYILKVLTEVRRAGISAEYYPDAAKLKKQMTYADKKEIPFVVFIGDDEIIGQKVSLKNMQTGDQEQISLSEMIDRLKN